MKYIIILNLLFISIMGVQAKSNLPMNNRPVETVNYVNLDQYLGTWYEIARFDHRFERGCTATTATYSKRSDGDIKVVNRCRIGSPDGKVKVATGRAWVVNSKTNAKLKVQFFLRRIRIPWLAGDYWILYLDEDYQTAIVGDGSRKYLWFLSRSKYMSEEQYQYLLDKAEDQGFDISKLMKVPQK